MRFSDPGPRRIAVSGASGLVGSALIARLAGDGHEVVRLVRPSGSLGADAVLWDVERGQLDHSALEKLDAVVHLAGENVGGGRWTTERKRRIRDSRVNGTRLLVEALGRVEEKPAVFVCASAVGFYGDTGAREVSETAPNGSGFLADVCREWEAEAMPLATQGVRVVCARFGVVLSPEGGALKKLLPVFRWGMGGRLGRGVQYMSWISLEDAVRAIVRAIRDVSLEGALNVVAPEPVTNREFTAELGRALRRPTFFPTPTFALQLAVGEEFARETLLGGQRVRPLKLEDAGFEWRHPRLELALPDLLEP